MITCISKGNRIFINKNTSKIMTSNKRCKNAVVYWRIFSFHMHIPCFKDAYRHRKMKQKHQRDESKWLEKMLSCCLFVVFIFSHFRTEYVVPGLSVSVCLTVCLSVSASVCAHL